jgi:6-pyruvoyltetrahydropterin/6-carboxytetrahydropterin synthase
MRVMATKRFQFDSMHCLTHHDGKCSQPHGHTYFLEITVEGVPLPVAPGNPKSGMIVDFGDLKKLVVDHLISRIDHGNLNEAFHYTTAEMMCIEIYNMLEPAIADIHYLPPALHGMTIEIPTPILRRVALWETPNSYAEAVADDYDLV